jgi:hypothetical protein
MGLTMPKKRANGGRVAVKSNVIVGFLAVALTGTANAAFSLQQLLQLTQNPSRIKATDAGLNHINGAVSAMYWEWGDLLERGVKLTRLNNNPGAWQLDLSSRAYLISKIAPQRQLLASITNATKAKAFDLYLIKAGVFKGRYLQTHRFGDGGLNLSVVTKTYATIAIRASELQQGGESQIYSYPLGTYLLYKPAFCSAPGALCR